MGAKFMGNAGPNTTIFSLELIRDLLFQWLLSKFGLAKETRF
jgi:hypothetical protein